MQAVRELAAGGANSHSLACRWRQGQASVLFPPSTSAACPPAAACSSRRRHDRSLALSVPRRGQVAVYAGPKTVVNDKWWMRNNPPNMRTVKSTQDFVDYLAEAGDRLVVVDFYAKWCHSCRSLFPKVCQLCDDPNILVLKVDWDENKEVCKALDVKVLPYIHLYRGSLGRVAQFSLSLPKIQKFKDALQRYGGERHDLGCVPQLAEFPDTRPRLPQFNPSGMPRSLISPQVATDLMKQRELQEA